MSVRGLAQPFSVTIASAVSLSSAIDLQDSYNLVSIVVPTMASGADVRVYGSDSLTGTYRAIYHAPTVATATPTVVNIPSSITNCIVPLATVGVRFLKVFLTTQTTDTSYIFKVICSR